MDLLPGFQIDALFGWLKGQAERMARRGQLPHYILPDGKTIRFRQQEVEALVRKVEVKESA